MKVEIEFPFVESFGDYHDIEHEERQLQKYHDTDVLAIELGMSDTRYYGVFYLKGQKPTMEEVMLMLEGNGFDINRDEINNV